MKYHLQVDGTVIKANLYKSKAFEYFDLIKCCFPNCEVSVIVTSCVSCFTEDDKK